MINDISEFSRQDIDDILHHLNRSDYPKLYSDLANRYNQIKKNSHPSFGDKLSIVYWVWLMLLAISGTILLFFRTALSPDGRFIFVFVYILIFVLTAGIVSLRFYKELYQYMQNNHNEKWRELTKGVDVVNSRFYYFSRQEEFLDDAYIFLLKVKINRIYKLFIAFMVTLPIVFISFVAP